MAPRTVSKPNKGVLVGNLFEETIRSLKITDKFQMHKTIIFVQKQITRKDIALV